jgi:hypothetical protein
MHPRHPLSPTFLFQLTRQKQSFFLEQQHIILAELANTARKICVDGEQSVGCDGAEPHKDLVMQLQAHLDGSHDRCKHLTWQIFSLTERSIGMITSSQASPAASPRSRQATSVKLRGAEGTCD